MSHYDAQGRAEVAKIVLDADKKKAFLVKIVIEYEKELFSEQKHAKHVAKAFPKEIHTLRLTAQLLPYSLRLPRKSLLTLCGENLLFSRQPDDISIEIAIR